MKCSFKYCSCPAAQKLKGQPLAYTFRYVHEGLGLIYYNIPKNASTSIVSAFYSSLNFPSLQPPQKPLAQYFKFAVCRNPWDRALSNYKMFTGHSKDPQEVIKVKQIKEFVKNPEKMSFLEFLHFTNTHDNHHWQTQYSFLEGADLDFIGRMENLQHDFNIICDKVGAHNKKLPHKNTTKRKHYSEYYDDETKELVAEKYAKDIEYFGYKFEN